MSNWNSNFRSVIIFSYCLLVSIGELILIITKHDSIPGALFVIISMLAVSVFITANTKK